jgi:hypothetical protein
MFSAPKKYPDHWSLQYVSQICCQKSRLRKSQIHLSKKARNKPEKDPNFNVFALVDLIIYTGIFCTYILISKIIVPRNKDMENSQKIRDIFATSYTSGKNYDSCPCCTW